jgi:Ni,Fe-hydrogenase III component G
MAGGEYFYLTSLLNAHYCTIYGTVQYNTIQYNTYHIIIRCPLPAKKKKYSSVASFSAFIFLRENRELKTTNQPVVFSLVRGL